MKRFWLLVCVLLLVAAPSGASSLGTGVAFLDTESAQDDNGAGFRLSLDAGERWNLDLRAAFIDSHGFVLGPRRFIVEATPIDLGLSYDFNPGARASFFAGAGVNYTLFKSEVFNTLRQQSERSRTEDEFGWYAVAGVEGSLVGSVGFFAEALYRQSKPSVDGDGGAALGSVPVDFAGVGGAVGICLRW